MGGAVTLDGSASSDTEGATLTYQWSFVTRPESSVAALDDATAVQPVFTPDLRGVYELQLVVNDGEDASEAATVMVTVLNRAPVADAGPNQSERVGTRVTLDGRGSFDRNRIC